MRPVLALAEDVDTAVTVSHQAIDAVTALHSPRAYDRLQILNTQARPDTGHVGHRRWAAGQTTA